MYNKIAELESAIKLVKFYGSVQLAASGTAKPEVEVHVMMFCHHLSTDIRKNINRVLSYYRIRLFCKNEVLANQRLTRSNKNHAAVSTVGLWIVVFALSFSVFLCAASGSSFNTWLDVISYVSERHVVSRT